MDLLGAHADHFSKLVLRECAHDATFADAPANMLINPRGSSLRSGHSNPELIAWSAIGLLCCAAYRGQLAIAQGQSFRHAATMTLVADESSAERIGRPYDKRAAQGP